MDTKKDTFSQLFDCDLSSVNSPDRDIHISALSLDSSSSNEIKKNEINIGKRPQHLENSCEQKVYYTYRGT